MHMDTYTCVTGHILQYAQVKLHKLELRDVVSALEALKHTQEFEDLYSDVYDKVSVVSCVV